MPLHHFSDIALSADLQCTSLSRDTPVISREFTYCSNDDTSVPPLLQYRDTTLLQVDDGSLHCMRFEMMQKRSYTVSTQLEQMETSRYLLKFQQGQCYKAPTRPLPFGVRDQISSKPNSTVLAYSTLVALPSPICPHNICLGPCTPLLQLVASQLSLQHGTILILVSPHPKISIPGTYCSPLMTQSPLLAPTQDKLLLELDRLFLFLLACLFKRSQRIIIFRVLWLTSFMEIKLNIYIQNRYDRGMIPEAILKLSLHLEPAAGFTITVLGCLASKGYMNCTYSLIIHGELCTQGT